MNNATMNAYRQPNTVCRLTVVICGHYLPAPATSVKINFRGFAGFAFPRRNSVRLASQNDAYLEVTINGTTLKPREKFTPPPFAKRTLRVLKPSGNVLNNYCAIGRIDLYARLVGEQFAGLNVNWEGQPPCSALLFGPETITNTVISLKFYPFLNDYYAPYSVQGRVSARNDTNAVTRYLSEPIQFDVTNCPMHTWITIPLSANASDRIIYPGEFTCFVFYATNPIVGTYHFYFTA